MITLQCEQFIFGLFNDLGYKLIKSPKVSMLLTDKDINTLCSLSQDTVMWFPDQDIITVTYIQNATDSYGRKGVWNHTIIIEITEYLEHASLKEMFADYARDRTREPPAQLDSLTIKV